MPIRFCILAWAEVLRTSRTGQGRQGQIYPFRRGGGSGATVLSSASRADGFVLLPPSLAEIPMGESADVYFYDA